ncbi:hypothetical protein CISIN_1g047299mg [Citrus sinensis]|uniref:Potassium transporter n=1 Tax=Citrus sinensis TaxID=2711 RepID=A0A067GX95_CITSI|nr:hypothetical protein CISIN_1g047299mg [Citrus sinensis]
MEDFENKTQISINKITILKLEKSCFAKHFLFFATLLGTSMLVGDGILTPCVSNIWLAKLIIFILEVHYITFIHSLSLLHFHPPVLSAVGGIKKATSTITNAINPWYIIDYFRRNKKAAWMTLGGTILCTTSKALFADVGHFIVLSMQINTCCLFYPALVLQYTVQASVLVKHPEYASDALYKYVLDPLYWSMVVMAILAAVIARHEGQVYVPEANYLLMLACVCVIFSFRSFEKMNNAYEHGVPPIFRHYVENIPALHSILVFVFIKSLPISKIQLEERFIFCKLEPKKINMYRCVTRYGYMDVRNESSAKDLADAFDNEESGPGEDVMIHEEKQKEDVGKEIETIEKAWQAGVVHLIGENEVVAAKGVGIAKRIMIDYAYSFLKKNLRQSDKVFDIPHKRMLKVGMTYEL